MTSLHELPQKAGLDAAQAALAALNVPVDARPTLDASTVESVDGCVVLTIAALAHAAAEAGEKIAVKEPSAAFVDAFSDLGLFQDLMKMEFVK